MLAYELLSSLILKELYLFSKISLIFFLILDSLIDKQEYNIFKIILFAVFTDFIIMILSELVTCIQEVIDRLIRYSNKLNCVSKSKISNRLYSITVLISILFSII